MALEDGIAFSQALMGLSSQIQQLSVQRTFEGAGQAVEQIKNSELSEAEQKIKIRSVANQLAMKMMAMGQPMERVQGMMETLSPGPSREELMDKEFGFQEKLQSQRINMQGDREERMLKMREAIEDRQLNKKLAAEANRASAIERAIDHEYGLKENLQNNRLDAQATNSQALAKLKIEAEKNKLTEQEKAVEREYSSQTTRADSAKQEGEQAQERPSAKLAKLGIQKEIFNRLPVENQVQIKSLATDAGKKTSIRNDITTAIERMKKIKDEDLQIQAGMGLIKTLNSRHGPDATGVEEVARLAPFLNYQKFNFTGVGPKFGRDIPAFISQAENVALSLDDAVKANKKEIRSLYGFPKEEPAKTVGGSLDLNQFIKPRVP